MRYFSMFTGIGGFEIGLHEAHRKIFSSNNGDEYEQERSSCSCIGFCEKDKFASKVLRYKFPEVKNYGDATKIRTEELPDFDCLVAGFPCQAFSIAGKRRGFEDTRGTLFFEIARVLQAKKPVLVVLENVKGLLSHNKGETFSIIIKTLYELGYDVEWGLVNSRYYGVPQNRERVFIIGRLRGRSRQKIFPLEQTTKGFIKVSIRGKHQQDIVYREDGIMCSLPAGTHGSTKHLTKTELILRDGRDNRSCLRSGRTTELGIEGKSIRRLTPKECERLQGFPDDWTRYGSEEDGTKIMLSDTQRYKMCGNAVTTNVVEAIFKKILLAGEE